MRLAKSDNQLQQFGRSYDDLDLIEIRNDEDEGYADWECCFRKWKMNLTNPARTDPIMATYSNQLVGLSLPAISNQKLIPNMIP